MLLRQLAAELDTVPLILNGEDADARQLLTHRSAARYRELLGSSRLLFVDEAQKVPEIGAVLKLMIDEVEGLQILATGSSAFDLEKITGEPLTGRKKTFRLFAFAEGELRPLEAPTDRRAALERRLVLGNYPELMHIPDRADEVDYLREIVDAYLLKDILAFERVSKADRVLALLRLLAFQVGSEVSHLELARQLGMSKNTVERYIDLLTKVFVVYPVGGFSRNLRKEVVKSKRYYFLDNGLRNVLAANVNPLAQRGDAGQLWENYAIAERIKWHAYTRSLSYNYFWRTYDQQEIDWVEERDGRLFGYEMKWSSRRRAKVPVAWAKAYPGASFEVITPDNYAGWLGVESYSPTRT